MRSSRVRPVAVSWLVMCGAILLPGCASGPRGGEPSAPALTQADQAQLQAETSRRLEAARQLSLNAFDLADADRNGSLDRDEWRAKGWLTYGAYDADRSGALTRAEFLDRACGGLASGSDQRRWCENSAGGRFRSLARGQSEIRPSATWPESDRDFRRNDLNRDGAVTPEERLRASAVR